MHAQGVQDVLGGLGLGMIAGQLADLQLGELLDTPPPGLDEAVAIAKVGRPPLWQKHLSVHHISAYAPSIVGSASAFRVQLAYLNLCAVSCNLLDLLHLVQSLPGGLPSLVSMRSKRKPLIAVKVNNTSTAQPISSRLACMTPSKCVD